MCTKDKKIILVILAACLMESNIPANDSLAADDVVSIVNMEDDSSNQTNDAEGDLKSVGDDETDIAQGEVNDNTEINKSKETSNVSVKSKKKYGSRKLVGKTVRWKLPDGEYDTVQYALSEAANDKKHKYYIKVPKGTYISNKTWNINGKNIILDMRGATFKRPKNVKVATIFFRIGRNGKGKYKGAQNIKLIGGTLDNGKGLRSADLMTIVHSKNVTIKGMTFKFLPKKKLGAKGRNGHMIETSAVTRVLIKKCKFYNNRNCQKNNEAVQFESNVNSKEMIRHWESAGYRDGTTTSHVTVTQCYFKGFRYGCGSNHLAKKDTFKHMVFTKNKFVGAKKFAICMFRFKYVKIKGNRLVRCGRLYQNQFSSHISD